MDAHMKWIVCGMKGKLMAKKSSAVPSPESWNYL